MGQNLVPLVNIKIAGKWMFIPLKMVSIGIDPFPFNHHFNQRVNSPLLWGDLGRGHPLISMMHTQCAGQHSRNTRDGIGDTSYIHIHIIYIYHIISHYIISYHIISYYVYIKVTLYNMFAVLNIWLCIYIIVYIYVYSYIFVYIYIYTHNTWAFEAIFCIDFIHIYIYIYLFIYLFILHRRAFWLGCSFSRTGGVTVGWQGRASNHIVAGMWFWS